MSDVDHHVKREDTSSSSAAMPSDSTIIAAVEKIVRGGTFRVQLRLACRAVRARAAQSECARRVCSHVVSSLRRS